MTNAPLTIAILGGTGQEGSGLALRLGKAGHRVIVGSRDAARAEAAAGEMNGVLGREAISGMTNKAAAGAADIVMLTVPYAAQRRRYLPARRRQHLGKLEISHVELA